MIFIKSPLRITFGGKTDLPSFYNQMEDFLYPQLLINIYINMYEPFKNYFLKYSTNEKVKNIQSIKHPVTKVLERYMSNQDKLEISGSGCTCRNRSWIIRCLTVALIKAIYSFKIDQ